PLSAAAGPVGVTYAEVDLQKKVKANKKREKATPPAADCLFLSEATHSPRSLREMENTPSEEEQEKPVDMDYAHTHTHRAMHKHTRTHIHANKNTHTHACTYKHTHKNT
ncbi:hypothetical protein J4Q44_G00377000, partial [Coregonus suidteri]